MTQSIFGRWHCLFAPCCQWLEKRLTRCSMTSTLIVSLLTLYCHVVTLFSHFLCNSYFSGFKSFSLVLAAAKSVYSSPRLPRTVTFFFFLNEYFLLSIFFENFSSFSTNNFFFLTGRATTFPRWQTNSNWKFSYIRLAINTIKLEMLVKNNPAAGVRASVGARDVGGLENMCWRCRAGRVVPGYSGGRQHSRVRLS